MLFILDFGHLNETNSVFSWIVLLELDIKLFTDYVLLSPSSLSS